MPAVPAECGCGLRIAVFLVGIDEALYLDENGGQDRMVRAEKVKPIAYGKRIHRTPRIGQDPVVCSQPLTRSPVIDAM